MGVEVPLVGVPEMRGQIQICTRSCSARCSLCRCIIWDERYEMELVKSSTALGSASDLKVREIPTYREKARAKAHSIR